MRNTLSSSLLLGAACVLALQTAVVAPVGAQDATAAQGQPAAFSVDQLDNLVAPVALYPDPLLAQVLLAATFPDQIQEAAQYVRANGTDGIDGQYWDVSVKAVAHYPSILNTMDTRIDWTTSLGQAYASQSTDVMQAVQHMRQLAQAQGNLQTTAQQQVVADAGNIQIWPAQPQVIYVPVYDPSVIYCQPVFYRAGFNSYFSFGVGYPIGAWLMYDWDWPARRIVYTGWYGGGWIARSRPYVRLSGVYVNPSYRRIDYDRNVVYRHPDYNNIHRYDAIHRGVNYNNLMASNGPRYAVPRDGHGVVSRTGGYRQPVLVTTGAHERSAPATWSGTPRRYPEAGTRTAQPRYTPAPQVYQRNAQPRYTPAPQVYQRNAQPRYTPAPQTYERTAQPRYTPAPQTYERTAQPRYTPAPRSQPVYRAPSRPAYSAPRAPAPSEQHRSAHRGG